MKAVLVAMNWNPKLPIFAREQFLRSVSDEYGWLGGRDDDGTIRCLLPYTIIKKGIFVLARFRVETIPLVSEFSAEKEKEFLTSCVEFLRSRGVDVIIPGTTNCVFRTYPDGAVAAPYGSYIIDLQHPEEVIWHKIERITRQNIKTAIKKGVTIDVVSGPLEPIHKLIHATFKRSKLPFMGLANFKRFIEGLGEYGLILKAEYNGELQSCGVFGFSEYCAYAIYAGNSDNQVQGANKLLYWEAIKQFKQLGVNKYDFVGARINPEKGSKQEALSIFKRHFGAQLVQGYIWKYPIKPLKYFLYRIAAWLRSGGDIVEVEKHKLSGFEPDR